MLCAVYKSIRKSETYLFIEKRDDFDPVPEQLLSQFGPPVLISLLNIEAKTKMALATASTVISEIQTKGYYLQLPPPPINYLNDHKEWRETQLEVLNESK